MTVIQEWLDLGRRVEELENELAAARAAAVEETKQIIRDTVTDFELSVADYNLLFEKIDAIATAPAGFVCVPVEPDYGLVCRIICISLKIPDAAVLNMQWFQVKRQQYLDCIAAARPK